MLENIIALILVPLGILCLFRPFLLLYLFTTIMVLKFAPMDPLGETKHAALLKIGSINLYATDYLILILFLLLMIFVAKNLINKRQLVGKVMNSQISKLILALFIWYIFIGVLSYDKGFELQNILRNIATAALMFIALLIPTIPDVDFKKERFFKYSIWLGILLVGFALWKYFISHDVELTSSGTLRSLLGNTVIIFMLPICYILFYSKYHRQHKLLSYTLVALLTIGIALTGHRSGIVTMAFVILMYFMAKDFKLFKHLWIPTAGITMLLLVVLISSMVNIIPGKSFLGDLVLRTRDTFNMENKTTQERLSKWDYSIEIMKKYPFLGLGRFPVHTDSIEDNSNLKIKYKFDQFNRADHNMFAEQIANSGVLGLAVMLIFIYVILKQFKNIPPHDHPYADFLKIYVLSFLIFSQFNTSFSDPLGKIFLFIMLGFLNVQKLKETGSLPAFSS